MAKLGRKLKNYSKYLLLAAFIIQSGCVLKSKYEKLDQGARELNKEIIDLQKERDDLKTDIAEKRKAVSQIENRNEELSRLSRNLVEKNKMLADELTKYRRKSMTLESELIKKDEKLERLNKTHRQITEDLKSEIADGNVKIEELEGMLKVNVVSAILFESGSHKIRKEGEKVLKKVADTLKGLDDKLIEVQGHTDNVRIKGSLKAKYPSNWELSTARATSVLRYLESNGVPPKRLKASGYGEYRPIESNNTEEGRQKNRRIEIILLPLVHGKID